MFEGLNITDVAHLPSSPGILLHQGKIQPVVAIGQFLIQIGDFRYNIRSRKVEVKISNEEIAKEYGVQVGVWTELTDRIVNTIWCKIELAGAKVPIDAIYKVLNSAFCPIYDPIQEYLNGLKEWDGVDYIKQLTDRIILMDNSERNRNYLEICFKKWFVRMVKSWLDESESNECIILLIGEQKTYKTTFIKYLLPQELRPYFKEHFNVELINKDTRIELSENLLINIDDISNINRRVNGELKNLTSLSAVKERRAYGRNVETYPRIASFAAISNVLHLLTDETGNRRWLAFHVKEITPSPHPEKGEAFNYDGIYGQVKAHVEQGFDYEFTDNEIEEIECQNRQFMAVNVAEELICKHFCRPVEGGDIVRKGATDVYNIVCEGKRIPGLTVEDIGKALVRLGFEYTLSQGQRKYKLQRIDVFIDTEDLTK